MALEIIHDKYTNAINAVEIGAPKGTPGGRGITVRAGQESTMPFLFGEGEMPNRPVMAMEVLDSVPEDWPDGLTRSLADAMKDPARWAIACKKEYGADAICVRLVSAHPDSGNRPIAAIAKTVKEIIQAVDLPLIVVGSGDDDRDRDLLPEMSNMLKGERCLLGIATQNNYKTLAAACLADGHSIIAESPIDINIAKQVNILISDMGFDPKRIVIHPTTASLGYGLEYVYSIMERARIAAFGGDWSLAMPIILFVGQEVWRVKEAKESAELGVSWEIATAAAVLQAGADILIMRHPKAAVETKRFIETMMKR